MMYILRTNDNTACPPGIAECTPKFAITGTDPSEKESTTHGPVDYGKPGPRRFIGIGMVAGMLFVALAAYVILGKAPKRWIRTHCRWGKRRREGGEGGVKVTLDPSYTSSSLEEVKTRAGSMESIAVLPDTDNNDRTRLQPNRKQPRDEKGSGRAAAAAAAGESGMMPSAKNEDMGVNGRSGGLAAGWEVEHLRGVCYQVLAPKDDVRIVDQIQTPRPTYQRR